MTSERPTHCADCDAPLPAHPPGYTGAAGYAIFDGRYICCQCAHRLDMAEAERTGRLFCYVKLDAKPGPDALGVWNGHRRRATLTSWPGIAIADADLGPAYRVPTFGWPSTRRSVRATLPDGTDWYGTYYESAGDYARLKRCKR